ncbi:MAG: hypothetical protein Q8R37_05465 [Nanoarchaeota archaeon]|nr:hypothetical protein [Nanoarchaeota archaeon]
MALENVAGNLLAYKELEPGTFQHVDQLTTERRTNHELRSRCFYTADGELYTVQGKKQLWAITRESQNLVLQDIDQAYRQLTGQGNYFPDTEAAQSSLKHADTVVIDLKGLKLVKNNDRYGHVVVNPKDVKRLNSQQKMAAQRIYGPDEENFGLNMEMFADAGKTPSIFVLMPGYVQGALREKDTTFLARASWLYDFYYYSTFFAIDRYVYYRNALRGVRLGSAEASQHGSHERSDLSGAAKNKVPSVPQEITPTICYETLLADRDSAVAAMDDMIASGLSKLVADYLAIKAQ